MTDSDSNVYLTVDSMIETNNIITCSNNITLRRVNVKPYEFDKKDMDKYLKEDKFTPAMFYSILFNEIHQFYDGNGRTCKILFGNDNKINLLIKQKLKN